MEILGFVFAGTATDRRAAMSDFVEHTLGLRRSANYEGDASMFELPDGSRFAVHDEYHDQPGTTRTIGFLVTDIGAACRELAAAGIIPDEPQENELHRYVHFTAPDGELYELVELLRPEAAPLTS